MPKRAKLVKPPMVAGRLALREEGRFWVAYYAQAETMEGALVLGSIALKCVQTDDRRRAFLALMRDAVGDIIEEIAGVRPSWPVPEGEVAPEHERAGNA